MISRDAKAETETAVFSQGGRVFAVGSGSHYPDLTTNATSH